MDVKKENFAQKNDRSLTEVLSEVLTQKDYNKVRAEVYTDIEKTDLRIWNIDYADSYPELEDGAKDILRVILKSDMAISVSKIREETGLSDYKVRKCLETLGEKKLVQRIGSGPATKYAVRETSDEKITQLQIALDNLKTKE